MLSCLLGIRGISFHATDKEAMEDHIASTVYQSGSQQPQGTSGLTNTIATPLRRMNRAIAFSVDLEIGIIYYNLP